MPKFTPDEALSSAPSLFDAIQAMIAAGRKDSPGGKKFTPEEWLGIGEKFGLVVLGVAKDAVD